MNSGIYIITNRENGKVYIGSTIDFERRWYEHRKSLNTNEHCNPHLQSAWNKYGEDAFEFGILEYLNNFDALVKAEQFWMDVYREEGRELYNYGLAADNAMRGQKHTEETRQKMRISAKDRGLGSKHSEETKRKMSETRTGHKHGPMSEEQKIKISKALIGHTTTEETRRKISSARSGQKLRPMSKEHKHKLSMVQKAAWAKKKSLKASQ